MISLSITTGYAIKALMCLESGECVARHISDIARCTGMPRAYLGRILSALAQQGLVQAKRGYSGGISLARSAEEISLLQIVEAVEGDQWLAECLLGLDDSGIHTNCAIHDFWARFRREITEELPGRQPWLPDGLPPMPPRPGQRIFQAGTLWPERGCAATAGPTQAFSNPSLHENQNRK